MDEQIEELLAPVCLYLKGRIPQAAGNSKRTLCFHRQQISFSTLGISTAVGNGSCNLLWLSSASNSVDTDTLLHDVYYDLSTFNAFLPITSVWTTQLCFFPWWQVVLETPLHTAIWCPQAGHPHQRGGGGLATTGTQCCGERGKGYAHLLPIPHCTRHSSQCGKLNDPKNKTKSGLLSKHSLPYFTLNFYFLAFIMSNKKYTCLLK